MYKKILIVVITLISFLLIGTVNAESLSNYIDFNAYEDVYRLSEDSNVSLPFVKFFNNKAFFDKSLNKTGLSLASQTIEINEKISGVQCIMSADTVDIKGSIEYGFIVASNVIISGTVEKDVFILAESVFITDTANIGNDIVLMSEKVELKGNVKGNFIAGSSDILIEGNVEKDLRVNSEKVGFKSPIVGGNIYIETNSEIDISNDYPNAIVKKIQTPTITKEEKKAETINSIMDAIIAVIIFTLLNMLIVWLRPDCFKKLSEKASKHSTYLIVSGVIGIVTIPLTITLLLVLSMFKLSVVTIPVLVAYIALIVVTISLAKFITGSVIYELVKDKFKVESKAKRIGVLLGIYASLYILSYIPYIGYYVIMATVLIASGIVITGLTRKLEK